MNKLSLEQLRKLYSKYSPLTSNLSLYNNYIEVTGDTYPTIDSIREKYNQVIFNGYLNEAVIKTSFINKFCVNKSPNKTITMFELKTGNSRADICIVNGSSSVFEIKTEFDTFNRLDNQINDYKKCFDYLNVVIPIDYLDRAITEIDSSIGIVVYRMNRVNKITFDLYRNAAMNKNTDPKTQLDQLSKNQLKHIYSIDASKEDIISQIIKLYSKNDINKLYKKYIKEKYKKQWEFLLVNRDSIKPLDYQWFFHNNISTEIVYK